MLSKEALEQMITQDHELEGQAEQSSIELGKHRWHWTLDESNEDRFVHASGKYAGQPQWTDYGKHVGRTHEQIRRYARAYDQWQRLSVAAQAATTFSELLALQKVKEEDREIVKEVAKINQVPVREAATKHRDHVHAVSNLVADSRRNAEEEGKDWTPAQETKAIKEAVKITKKLPPKPPEEKPDGVLWSTVISGTIIRARDNLNKAIMEVRQLEVDTMDDALRQDLLRSTAKVVATAQLLETALGSTASIDWDAEFAKISESGVDHDKA